MYYYFYIATTIVLFYILYKTRPSDNQLHRVNIQAEPDVELIHSDILNALENVNYYNCLLFRIARVHDDEGVMYKVYIGLLNNWYLVVDEDSWFYLFFNRKGEI